MTTAAVADIKPLPRNTVVPVAGVSKYQDAAARTCIGDEVVLRHETSNPFDVDAVVITTSSGDKLGYVPTASRQNARLLVGHRGGVWGGVIVDKFDGETIGLRVKILTLLGHRSAAFGSDHHGLRATCDEPPVAGLDEQPAAATGTPAAQVTLVKARSGRLLGTLVETTGHRVRVQDTDGNITAFPAGIVTLEQQPG